MRGTRPIAFVALIVALTALAPPAQAAEFSPTVSFSLSSLRVRRNPTVSIDVAQDIDEEELAKVQLRIPRGYVLPGDGAIAGGEQLGEGEITIDVGPRCDGQGPLSGPANVPVSIVERDRTQDEVNAGVRAVWVVDLEPVTTIDLLVTGSSGRGWRLTGDIPQNDFTCPPFSFSATIAKTSSDSGVKIFRNPRRPGNYTFRAAFTGVDGSTKTISQSVTITA